MVLFHKDDFYSTKPSKPRRSFLGARRTRRTAGGSASQQYRIPHAYRSFTHHSSLTEKLKVIAISSVTSVVISVVVFGAVIGFDRADERAASLPASAAMGTDPYERTILAADKVRPAVVSIFNYQEVSGEEGTEEYGEGSGIIFSNEAGKARIITNAHVVEDAQSIMVMMSNGKMIKAEVIGTDQLTDLAVLEIPNTYVTSVAEIGDSSTLRAGQWVMAIGNPLGLSDSLTMGIVSKSNRMIPLSLGQNGNFDWEQEVIQVDASINHGNSGGPLINLDGQVIGINTLKVSEFGVEGVGFAIPINEALPIVNTLITDGKITRPFLGVVSVDLASYIVDEEDYVFEEELAKGQREGDRLGKLIIPEGVEQGVLVLEAMGPAQVQGLQMNDIIVQLDRQKITNTRDLRRYLYYSKEIGDSMLVTYYRQGMQQTVTVKLAGSGD